MDRYDLYNFTKSHTHSLTSRPSSMRVGDSRRPQRLLIIFGRERYLIQFSIHCARKFLNWIRTSCVVSITTVATLHTWTAHFCANFEQRIIGRTTNMWQDAVSWLTNYGKWHAYEKKNAERQHSNMCCNFWCHKTFYYSDRSTVYLQGLTFLFTMQRKLIRHSRHSALYKLLQMNGMNDAQLRIATVTCISW